MVDTTLSSMEKKKFGYQLPAPFVDAFEEVAARLGGKEKWIAMSAALLMFAEAGEEAQNEAMRRVQKAGVIGGSFDALLAEAKAKAEETARQLALARKGSVVTTTRPPRREGSTPAAGRSAGR